MKSDGEFTVGTAYSSDQALEYDRLRFSNPAGRAIHQTEWRMVEMGLELVRPASRVLEVGCGTGRLLAEMTGRGFELKGVDASPAMLKEARRKLPSVRFSVCDASQLPLEDDSFDFVFAIRLLNQTKSKDYALSVVSEMIRCARPGGYVLVEFVNSRRFWTERKAKATVALSLREIAHRGEVSGARLVLDRGAFLGGMTAFHRAPESLIRPVAALDGWLSQVLGAACARRYALFEKLL